MENFVLNLFSDQLSKIILNFNDARMKVNASFMAGKGSITNVKLNVDLINQLLTEPPHGLLPYLRLKEVTLTELRLEVTSYTNLKKAPVVLVIDKVFVKAEEMLEYHFDGKHNNNTPAGSSKNNSDEHKTKHTASQRNAQSNTSSKPKQTQYNLLHRITDNLSVRVNEIHIAFQPLGKLKTRRLGIWTPPSVEVMLKGVEWISVTQHGEVGTPEQTWSHNDLSAQQASMKRDAAKGASGGGHHHRMYTIYKRLSFKGCVGLIDRVSKEGSTTTKQSNSMISNCKIDVHVAYTRRLRDAAITGVDVDVMCHDADINLDLSPIESTSTVTPHGCSFQSVIHLMAGLQHCMYKDRSFDDPLLPIGAMRPLNVEKTPTVKDSGSHDEHVEIELGPDNFMPTVNMEDDDLDESSEDEEEPDEEHDAAFLAWKKEQGFDVDAMKTKVAESSASVERKHNDATDGNAISRHNSSQSFGQPSQAIDKQNVVPPEYKRKRKAVIVLASGAQKFEKLSFSLTLRRINAKLFLPRGERTTNLHCLEILTEGILMECIWPKPTGEIGGNIQCSMRYMHIMESESKDEVVLRCLPLMKIGCKLFDGRDLFSLISHQNNAVASNSKETDMLDDDQDGFQKRHVSWKWARPCIRGPPALLLKSTVSFVDEKLALWSKTFVVHEANIGEIQMCVDSGPLIRLAKVFSIAPWDDRWYTGDWMDEISSDLLVDPKWSINDHLQPIPAWYGSSSGKLSALSSDLRNITARFGGITIRIPHPVYSFSSCGLADVICSVANGTVLVTSQLPDSFLTGTITASDGTTTNFPNDEQDFSCKQSHISSSDVAAKFRMQITFIDFSLEGVPMPSRSGNNSRYLIAPTKITTMFSLQHTHEVTSNDTSGSQFNQSMLVSILIPRFESNLTIEKALSAASTVNYHLTAIARHAQADSFFDRQHVNAQIARNVNDETVNAVSVVCIHVSDVMLTLASNRADSDDVLNLARLRITRIEFGLEFACNVVANDMLSVYKCIVESFSLQMMTKDHELVDILKIGTGSDEQLPIQEKSQISIMLRACHSSNYLSSSESTGTSTLAVDVISPLIVSLDIDVMKTFIDTAIGVFSAPVYFYSKTATDGDTYDASTQSTMIALLSMIFELTALGNSSASNPEKQEPVLKGMSGTAFTRVMFSHVLVEIPKTGSIHNNAKFLLTFEDVDFVIGHSGTLRSPLLKQHCGHDTQWINIVGSVRSPDSFYAFKSNQSLISVDGCEKVLMPSFSVDYSSTTGDDVTKDLIDTSLTLAILMSHISMKLYFMIPSSSSKSRFVQSAREIHNAIGCYHSKVVRLLYSSEDAIDKLRMALFAKERERLSMLALTPSVCGWLRVCEGSDISFHRLFSTATLVRYWVVIRDFLLICFEYPGASTPVLVFPISALTTSLREITIPSNAPIGIVGTHLQQKGFALVDSANNTELFCVASDRDDYVMWASVISEQFKQASISFGSDQEKDQVQPVSIPKTELVNPSLTKETANPPSVDNNTITVLQDNHLTVDASNTTFEDTRPKMSTTPPSTTDDDGNNDDLDMESVEMETISLSTSEEKDHDAIFSAIDTEVVPIIEKVEQTTFSPQKTIKSTPTPSTRELLKKSRFTASTFNSVLNKAKEGAIAASEKGRDGLKQALEVNESQSSVPTRSDIGQRFNGLKQNANVKISKLSTAVRTTLQEHTKATAPTARPEEHISSSSGLETLGSESQMLDFPNNSVHNQRHEQMRKKLTSLDQSMSTTMKRLKIDEKLNTIGNAVRNAASEGQVVARQISNTGSVSQLKSSAQRQSKTIKFDARETFTSHSNQPVRVKSIKAGTPLLINDDYLSDKSRSLSKIQGIWIIEVEASSFNAESLTEPEPIHEQKLKITSTEIETRSVNTSSKSLSEICFFYTLISEMLSNYVNCAAVVTHKESMIESETMDPLLHKLSPFERIELSGCVLQGVLDATKSSAYGSTISQGQCKMINVFLQTIVSTDLPLDAIKATEAFLEVSNMAPVADPVFDSCKNVHAKAPLTLVRNADDAFEKVLHVESGSSIDSSSMSRSTTCHQSSSALTSLLDIMKMSYSKAIEERDLALAKLSLSSILQDNEFIQKHVGNSSNSPNVIAHQNIDDELQLLCKNLGKEIELRIAAEAEVKSLKEKHQLEQELAAAEKRELMAEVEKYKHMLKNN